MGGRTGESCSKPCLGRELEFDLNGTSLPSLYEETLMGIVGCVVVEFGDEGAGKRGGVDASFSEGGERLGSDWEYTDTGVGGDSPSTNCSNSSSSRSPREIMEPSDRCPTWPSPTHSCLPSGISSSGIVYSGLPGKLTSVGLSIEKLRKRDLRGYSIGELVDTREKITRPRQSSNSTD